MPCTPAEIAEKRRIALERLKAKKTLQESIAPDVQLKPAQPFHKKPEIANDCSKLLRVMHENKSSLGVHREARNLSQPYAKSSVKNNSESFKFPTYVASTVNCNCFMLTDSCFAVHPSSYLSKLIDVFKSIPSRSYDPNTKLWSFRIEDYDLVQTRVGALKPNVVIGTIPSNVLKLCSQSKPQLDMSCLSSIEPKIGRELMPFQKEGVCFGISKHGRLLIADEMGLGKTYQALAIADFYKDNWPLLICTSASTRDSWANHLKTLLPYIACDHVVVLTSNRDYIGDCKVLITSYNLMEKNVDKLMEKNFGVIILDESHTLKSHKARCTAVADHLARKSKRIILLSGTPALSRPVELFTQLQMIDRNFFNYVDYITRYCAAKKNAFGWDASGQSNLEELNVVLKRKFMIRRVKADVLPQLSEKSRETVILDPSLIWTSNDMSENLASYANDFTRFKGKEREDILIRYYAETAAAKALAVCEYLKNLVKEKTKFIVFAHHQVMMKAISNLLKTLKVGFIKIDGSTKNDLRTEYVEKFQTKKSCLVALLSLKACNTGITLTAANLVIFAELDWNPSTLAQAESRAHRIGQEGTVVCRYLLAAKTADDVIWQMLKNKQDVLNKAGLFCEDLQDGEHVLAPSSSPSIKKYLTPKRLASDSSSSSLSSNENKKVKNEMNAVTTDNDLKMLLNEDDDVSASFLITSYNKEAADATMEDNDFKKLLNEDDDDFADLDF